MQLEQPQYDPSGERMKKFRAGDSEMQRKRQERDEAFKAGKIAEWEKENPDFVLKEMKSEQVTKKDHMKGDPEKIAAMQAKLQKLYPPKPNQTPGEMSM